MNKNTKITLTVKQLRKLVAESVNELAEKWSDDVLDTEINDKGEKVPKTLAGDILKALERVRNLTSTTKRRIMDEIFGTKGGSFGLAESGHDGNSREEVLKKIVPGETILYSVFSYDCSIVNFYKVEGIAGTSTLLVRSMGKRPAKGETHGMQYGMVVPDEHGRLGEVFRVRVMPDGRIPSKGRNSYLSDYYIWDGEPILNDAMR